MKIERGAGGRPNKSTSGEGAWHLNTKKKEVTWSVPGTGEVLWAYVPGC